MIPPSRKVVIRALTLTTRSVGARSVVGGHACQRFLSSRHATNSVTTHVVAGVAGGAVVVIGGYAFYRYSGIGETVDSAIAVQEYFAKRQSNLGKDLPRDSSGVLKYLRTVASSYVGVIPGATSLIHSTFDALDDLHATHREEFDHVMNDIFREVMEVLKEAMEKQSDDVETAAKLLDVLRRRTIDLGVLSGKIGQDILKKLDVKYPGLRETVGKSFENLKNMAEKSGPEATKVLDQTVKQAQDLLSKGHVPDALDQAQKIIQENSSKLTKVIWKKIEDDTKNKPELRNVLDESKGALVGGGDGVRELQSVKEVVARAENLAKGGNIDEGQLKEFSDLVKGKAEELHRKGWEGAQSWIKGVTSTDPRAWFQSSAGEEGRYVQNLAEEAYKSVLEAVKGKPGGTRSAVEEIEKETERKPGR